jgi:xanthine dehydrogenase accessory factor
MDNAIFRSIAGNDAGKARPLALVTVLATKGSAPRHPGSKMLVVAEDDFSGTIGGGKGEVIALRTAAGAIAKKASAVIEVEMHGEEATGPNPTCGGSNRMLVEYIGAAESFRAPYRAALELMNSGRRALIARKITRSLKDSEVGVSLCVFDEAGQVVYGSKDGIDEKKAAAALSKGQAVLDEEKAVFYDPLCPEEKLLILGAGHVGRALAAAALPLGFVITVADDRPNFVFEGRFAAGIETIQGNFKEIIERFPFDPATYAVITTHGHLYDLECARAVLARPYRYVGMIGSARKTKLILEQAKADGFDSAKVEAICAPVGLDIAAETPEEIAVSILAEMIAFRRRAALLPRLEAERKARRA